MRTFTRKRFFLLVLATLILAAGIGQAEKVEWRARLALYKIGGRLPWVTWADLLHGFLPNSIRKGYQVKKDVGVAVRERAEGPCPVLWDSVAGPFWAPTENRWELEFPLYEQIHEDIYQKHEVTVRAGDVVLDVGSHLGTFTRKALKAGARLVVGFEIDPATIICYKKTFQEEIDAGRVILVEAAAWETSGELQFRNWGVATTVIPLPQADDARGTVVATTIDETIERLELDRVDFVKMDIEGSERHALRGAEKTLKRFRPRMALCAYHRWDDIKELPRLALVSVREYKIFTRHVDQIYFH